MFSGLLAIQEHVKQSTCEHDLAGDQGLCTCVIISNFRVHLHLFGFVKNQKIQSTKTIRIIGHTKRIRQENQSII